METRDQNNKLALFGGNSAIGSKNENLISLTRAYL